MEQIFYAERGAFASSETLVKEIFSACYGIRDAEFTRSENGKPFLSAPPPFFSVTHTKELYFVAVSDENIGIDAEPLSREIDYLPVLNKFSVRERERVKNKRDFLTLWTAKESLVKWTGGALSKDLKKLLYIDGKAFYSELELHVKLSIFYKNGHVVAICRERGGDSPPFIRFPS